jgi:hypothetical protein
VWGQSSEEPESGGQKTALKLDENLKSSICSIPPFYVKNGNN